MKNTVFHNNDRKMVNQFIREGKNLVYVINYLLSCEYNIIFICKVLTERYGCKKELILDTLKEDYDCFAVDCIEREI